ncbi:hypothetical protein CEUSTIGMA_g10859.t1 [Chlamydomonas eustigma]|uniref:DUS-like FMN-binding domain-containing protein n=1 Tax=Chlamydomonas eustigma TaxID=1157962 RepID=A0A250XK34_9CHLO|nr:hypothetical protein CEUSTIGMA_g10859.t1 [Chlamydomonas eustigma]|eukprot:GAX83434.1 hypothetical protein CEUSTIGMA_g10859.t1 [Chlamydomonas eustigma]
MAQSSGRQLLSVAPMMDCTDLHYRQLARIISKRTWLWTEMVVDKTILHTPFLDKFLWFPPEQHPIVCQLGGSDPATLAAAVKKVVEYGYDEINLNCGCPSDRVAGAGCFGASLMLQPDLVASCMKAMADASNGTAVTVKCRLGVDEVDSYEQLKAFINIVSSGSPVRHFIVHARKCFLHGLNPHQNRTVPPLRHEWVYSLRRDFPHLLFSLNGGVQNCGEAKAAILYEGPFPTPGHTEENSQQEPLTHHNASDTHNSEPSDSCDCPQASIHGALHKATTDSAESDRMSINPPVEASRLESTNRGSSHAITCGHVAAARLEVNSVIEPGESILHAADLRLTALRDGQISAPLAATNSSHEDTEGTGCAEDAQSEGVGNSVGLIEGVMIGRAAYNDPWNCLADADRSIFGEPANAVRSRREVLERYTEYCDAIMGKFGIRSDGHMEPNVRLLFKPLLGLFHAEPGSKRWKAAVDGVLKQDPPSVRHVLDLTLHHIPSEVLDSPPPSAQQLTTNSAAFRSFGDLAEPQDRAGFNQTLTALKRAAKEAASTPSHHGPKRSSTRAATLQDGTLGADVVQSSCIELQSTAEADKFLTSATQLAISS